MLEKLQDEIERKFLIKDINLLKEILNKSSEIQEIEQFYLSGKPTTVRYRIVNNEYAIECYKGKKSEDGLSNPEKEYNCSMEKAKELREFSMGTLFKTRYKIVSDGKVFEFDIYKGNLNGLIVAEVEFKTKKEALNFKLPDWFKVVVEREVTEDNNYSNFNLAVNGFKNINQKSVQNKLR